MDNEKKKKGFKAFEHMGGEDLINLSNRDSNLTIEQLTQGRGVSKQEHNTRVFDTVVITLLFVIVLIVILAAAGVFP